jgi:hypothetical protein
VTPSSATSAPWLPSFFKWRRCCQILRPNKDQRLDSVGASKSILMRLSRTNFSHPRLILNQAAKETCVRALSRCGRCVDEGLDDRRNNAANNSTDSNANLLVRVAVLSSNASSCSTARRPRRPWRSTTFAHIRVRQ